MSRSAEASHGVTAEKINGAWYAWREGYGPHSRDLCVAKRKRDVIEAVHRANRKGEAAERLDFKITDRLIDRPKKNRHPVMLRVNEAMAAMQARVQTQG